MFESEKRLIASAVDEAVRDPRYKSFDREELLFIAADAIHNGVLTVPGILHEIDKRLLWRDVKAPIAPRPSS